MQYNLRYTLFFAACICVVCSVLVSTAAVQLKSRQEENRILDRQKNVQHAGEAETSMMLALTPELIETETLSQMHGPMVHNASGIEGVPKGAYRWRRISSRSPNGVIGDAATATPEKGERLLETYARRLAEVLSNPDYWSAAT